MEKKEKQLSIQYVQSSNFSSVFSSGVYGGVSINGTICMNFYIDRVPLPENLKVQIQEDGKLVEESYLGTEVINVREVTSCTVMDYQTARSFHDWLGTKLAELEKALNEQK